MTTDGTPAQTVGWHGSHIDYDTALNICFLDDIYFLKLNPGVEGLIDVDKTGPYPEQKRAPQINSRPVLQIQRMTSILIKRGDQNSLGCMAAKGPQM